MKKYFIIFTFLFTTSIFASFELNRDISPRGIAMGNSIMADPDPINGILYNPALLGYSRSLMWQGLFGMNYLGLTTTSLQTFNFSLIVPFTYQFKYDPIFQNLVLGLAFNRLTIKDSNSVYDANDDIHFTEQFISIALGKKYENLFSPGTLLSIGLNINILTHILQENQDVLNNDYFSKLSVSSVGIDVGATYFLNKAMVVAGSIENLIQPNISYNKTITSDKVLPIYKLGLIWKMSKLLFMENVTIAGSLAQKSWEDKNDIRKKPLEYHLGYEFYKYKKLLAVRLGYQWSFYGNTLGFSDFSIGLGTQKTFQLSHTLVFDISYQIPLFFSTENALVGTYGTTKAALSYKFDFPASILEFNKQKREELQQNEELERIKKEQAKSASQGYNLDNLSGADASLTKANIKRNTALLDLFNKYSQKRDGFLKDVNQLKKDAAGQIQPIDKKIKKLTIKREKTKVNTEKEQITQELNNLNKKKQEIIKNTNQSIALINKKLIQLKKDTAKEKNAIEKEYDKAKKKFLKDTTDNFKEYPPTINLDNFSKEINK